MAAYSTANLPGLSTSPAVNLKTTQLSVCIVTYKARDWLEKCLESLQANTQLEPIEIVVVDNGSGDGVDQMLISNFPQVRLIENQSNQGYSRPMNQSLKAAAGRYLMQLNPDTLILPGALDSLFAYMEDNPQVGICGPKVLNADGSFQKQCRRGEPRPLAVVSYFLGLPRLFPQNKAFAGYLLETEHEDSIIEVAAVSGSCMLIRRQVVDQIGYLDERFYAYQEDTDICSRARGAGWKVVYFPESKIIHYGGRGGSRVEPFQSIIQWHKSYYLYYKKHLAKDYFFLFNWLYYLLMALKLSFSLLVNLVRGERFAGPKR
jgi:GT2 family glycosyltransferase